MKKILTVETVKDGQKVIDKFEELKAYILTEKGFAEFSKELNKLWDTEFSDSDENPLIGGMLVAYWLGFDDAIDDEIFTLFGKKMANFMIAVLDRMSTKKAKEMLKEIIMAE